MKARDMDEMLGTTARLAIVLTLAEDGEQTFTALRQQTGLADGNLHVQTRKLRDAGYLEARKVTSGKRQVTAFRLTDHGRKQLGDLARRLTRAAGFSVGEYSGSSRPARTPRRTGSDDSQVW